MAWGEYGVDQGLAVLVLLAVARLIGACRVGCWPAYTRLQELADGAEAAATAIATTKEPHPHPSRTHDVHMAYR